MTLKDLKQKIDSLLERNPEFSDKKLLLIIEKYDVESGIVEVIQDGLDGINKNHYIETDIYFVNILVTNNRTNET